MPAEAPLLDSDLEIREALPDDAHAIAALYVWHVLNGRASFEEIPPTVDEMRKRIQTVRDNGLPWLVALWRGAIVGYCYATFYRPRPAYRYTLEESIYVESGMGGRGIGSALLSRLIAECEKGPWRQMLAIIGDGHNNAGSLAIHKKVRLYRGGSAAQRRLQDGRLAGYVDYAARAG
ncbi:GCN5-related N-acetyltransferase [Klebsiella pneumoniae IS53]|uniref:GCN5-related N-acetyltransferase n=1 Tax=Klebsiella pneumoniae IS43 TaxID=1432552 RepID=W1DT61_KLEPN|nr:GCN5-related N-acetyltransferase [Klebsiella pneumoniae IS43]CDL23940.1 GCN5-related N-acetyltransferase [Klebsiella pneumoniae IS53]